jgi:hypothetical protein
MGQNQDMADNWKTVKMEEVQVGDRVRYRGSEFVVARVDDRFLGRDEMVCLIEDNPQRWHAYPGPRAGDVEVEVA